MRLAGFYHRKMALLPLLLFLCFGNARAQPTTSTPAQRCLDAAKKALGPDAQVLKCGHITGTDALEAVAAIRLKQFRTTADGVPISKLVILREQKSRWVVELTADKNWIRNNIGYLSDATADSAQLIRFLASYSAHFIGYRVSFSDRRSDEASDFTIWLYILSPTGINEGTSLEISWNPSAQRFQDFAYGQDPEGFRPEIKDRGNQ